MTHHWQALGWTLLHFLWQGAAIALVYRVADLALARRSANARYVLALGALLGMLAVSVGTLAWEESAFYQPTLHTTAALRNVVATRTEPYHFALDQAPAADPLHQADRFVLAHLMPYLDALWLIGVLFLSIRTLGGWWLIRRLRSRLERAPHTLLLRLDVLRRQMNIPRFVDLRLSTRITNPLTAGVVRPWILLPITALTSLSPEQLEVVLSHELAHIRRADYLWNLLQTIVETLFFFHPAVWWISRRVREERELCCDDVALRSCSDPTVYASALLRLEEERRTRLHLAMALDGHQSRAGLRARILRILGDREAAPSSFRPISFVGIATALLVFCCPLPKVFASFRAVPQVAARIAPAASQVARTVAFKAMHPMQVAPPTPKPTPATPAAAPEPASTSDDAQNAEPAPEPSPEPQSDEPKTTGHSDYIDAMRAAGYDVDLDKYIAMKVQGITPAYAAEMSKVFNAKLSADKLIALKVQDVSPDYIAKMRAAGYDVDAGKFISMRVQDITPEYADAMAKVGFGKPTVDQLLSLKVQGVTPDYVAQLHAGGIEVSSFNDLVTYRIFNVSPEFVVSMKAAGYADIPAKKLVALRVQSVTPDFAKSVKAQFPDATLDDIIKMRIFNINADFIASAKSHGFEPLTIQKLVKLRISGILDDADDKK
jgi:beta-lactamase regulating signal transducer with metallopeptidase domain